MEEDFQPDPAGEKTDPRTAEARKLLEDVGFGGVAVSKTIRAGLTTSAVLASREMGKKILCISPTTRIIKETVGKASGDEVVRIPGNYECPKLAAEIDEFPVLKDLPLSLPDCEKCRGYLGCAITEILRHPDFDVAALTYAKVQALMLSRSKSSKKIRSILSKADYVLLDEAHLLGFGSVPSVPVGLLPEVPEKYKVLSKTRTRWVDLLARHCEKFQQIQEKAQDGLAGQHLSLHADIPEPLDWRTLSGAWSEIRTLAKSYEMERLDILMMRDAIEILSYPWGSIHYVSKDEGREGRVVISGSRGKDERAISEFLHNIVPYAGHIYASGTLIEPHEGYFAELSGKTVSTAVFPDIKRTSERVTLIPDTWRLSAQNFKKCLPEIVDQIRQIAEKESEPIYCLCPNKIKAAVVRSKLEDAGIKGVTVDYYRSDMSIGVARQERICIAVGLAEIPSNAYDPLARGLDEGERWIDSRRLRLQAVHAATWQAINRVRDPEGARESRVYMIGVRLDQIRSLARWGPDRQAVPDRIQEGRTPDGRPWRSVYFTITVSEEIEHCNIFGEDKHSLNPDRRSLPDMVARIELYDENKINSQNPLISPINIYRHNDGFLGFYNFPSIDDEYEITASALCRVFVHRDEVYAQQFKDSNGKWGFSKVPAYVRRELVLDHIMEKKTIGVYEIGLDDDVIWGAIDVDSHSKGETGEEAREKVRSICDVLDVYGIPYLLEASGSPGSYHIWIFFEKTRTYNAFRFMRQVAKEADIGDIEIWPKQKRLGKNNKYGNLVKLPICLHNKTGARSAFIDVETFEPLEGFIPFPGRVALLEIPELTPGTVGAEGMPKAKINMQGFWDSTYSLDYCMIRTLEEKVPLEGSKGHLLRVAIAAKAAAINMTVDDTARLFANQPDFNFTYSQHKAEEIAERGYSPWSCETLKDNCGEYVTKWCPTCQDSARAIKTDTEPYRTYLVIADVPRFSYGGRSWNLVKGDIVGGLPRWVTDPLLVRGALKEVGG